MLRRAMGKKIQAEMDAQRPVFLEGAEANGVPERKAVEVWNLLDKFANYGFNKSHAAAYAVVSYQTAWLKANHPVEFMAAVMNLDLHHTEKLNAYVQECRRTGVEVAPPCVNRSEATFTVQDGRILYALGALRNVGVEAMRAIVSARAARADSGDAGPFADLFDLARRVELRLIGRRPLENLARAGAFDALEPNRARVLGSLDALVDYSSTSHADRASAQVSLFGTGEDALPPPRLARVEDWLPTARLGEELGAIGFYLSGHPLDDHMPALRRKRVMTGAEFMAGAGRAGGAGRVAGTLAGRRDRKSARGRRFAILAFSDPDGLWEATAWAEELTQAEDLLQPGRNLVLHVQADIADEQTRLTVRAAQPVEQVTQDAAPVGLEVHVADRSALESIRRRLEHVSTLGSAAARRRHGEGPVKLILPVPELGQEVEIDLPGQYAVSAEIRGAIKSVPGVQAVRLI